MRFIFKTRYEQDIALAKHGGHVLWYGLLMAGLLLSPWLLPEYWMLFAALPMAVAVSAGRTAFWLTGAVALKAMRRALPALMGYLISAVVVMVLVRYATEVAQALGGATGWLAWIVRGLSALALAMLRGWLCLAAILVMLRHEIGRAHV